MIYWILLTLFFTGSVIFAAIAVLMLCATLVSGLWVGFLYTALFSLLAWVFFLCLDIIPR